MEMMLIVVSLVSLAIATAMSVVAWKLVRDHRQRSDARVEALETLAFGDESGGLVPALATGPIAEAAGPMRMVAAPTAASTPAPATRVAARFSALDEADAAPPPAEALFESRLELGTTTRRWYALVGAATLMAIGAATVYALSIPGILSRNVDTRQASLATRPLELTSLRYSTDEPGYFTVSGIVHNPIGAPQLRGVVAVVYLFDADGQYVGNGKIALDVSTLDPGLESLFMIRVPTQGAVARYRVGFRFPDGSVVSHIDKRSNVAAPDRTESEGS
jgi:hypothetical protein